MKSFIVKVKDFILKEIKVSGNLNKAFKFNIFYNEVSDVKVFVREFIENDLVSVMEIVKRILNNKTFFKVL